MKPIKGYKDVEASTEFERLAAGGYVIRMTAVADDEKKEYLSIVFDIAEGQEAGRFKSEPTENDYRHRFIRSYKEKALPMLKAFTLAVDETNGTSITGLVESGLDERLLVGKIVGAVFGYEEYTSNDGTVKERLYLKSVMSADKIRKGEFKVPELRKLKESSSTVTSPVLGFSPVAEDDLPF